MELTFIYYCADYPLQALYYLVADSRVVESIDVMFYEAVAGYRSYQPFVQQLLYGPIAFLFTDLVAQIIATGVTRTKIKINNHDSVREGSHTLFVKVFINGIM